MPAHGELLGDFLRTRREGLKPEEVGLPARSRRRTPGLRREDVAGLAGISVEWYVKLEQGRATAPSLATVEALANALRLSGPERAHLTKLARAGHRSRFVRETMPPALDRFIQVLDQPAYVTGLRWDLIALNQPALRLFEGLLEPSRTSNLLAWVLTDPRARALFGDAWAGEARRMVALFRTSHDVWADDPAFIELLSQLSADCPEFPGWWKRHDIGIARSGRKTLYHPRRGTLHFEYSTFQSNDDAGLKLSVYTPA